MHRIPENKTDGKWLRTMTRLMVGGVELGLGKLLEGLESLGHQPADAQARPATGAVEATPQAFERAASPSLEQATGVDDHPGTLRYALIGLVFESQDSLLRGMQRLDRLSRAASRLAAPWVRPVQHSRLLRPLHRQVDRLAERGEAELTRLVERGRWEAAQSHRLTESAVSSTLNHGLDYLTTSPEVQELVQTQSSGLASEMLEEIRERTVSADNFLEEIARRIVRRAPRRELPAPPVEVIQRATAARGQSRKAGRSA